MRFFNSLLSELPAAQTEFEQQVFDFCQAWKSGQQEFLFHSSGSTGDPKPILISRERLYASAKMTGEWLNLQKGDHALLALPVHYIAGALVLVRTLVHDLGLILVDPCQNPLQDLPPIDIHLASFVPTQWATIIESGIDLHLFFSKAKGVLLGGASVPQTLRKERGFPVFETYGMTETVSHIAFRTWKDLSFQILPGVQIAKNDQDCLLICAPVTENKWIETRDVVDRIDTNHFQLLGRLDRVINSGGLKIQPEKVENVYSLQTACSLFAYGLTDAFWGQKLVLFVESESPLLWDETAIMAKLGSQERPKEIIYLPSFIKTASAKIDTSKTVTLYFNSI